MAPGCNRSRSIRKSRSITRKGCTITDVDGNDYLDFIAGIAVGSLGHGHPRSSRGSGSRLERVTFGSFARPSAPRSSERIAAPLPARTQRAQLYSGGAEAVEAAFRLAKSASKTRGTSSSSFWGGFHGKTGRRDRTYRRRILTQAIGPFPAGHVPGPLRQLLPLPVQAGISVVRDVLRRHLRDQQSRTTPRARSPRSWSSRCRARRATSIPPDDSSRGEAKSRRRPARCSSQTKCSPASAAPEDVGLEHFGLKPDIMTIGKGMGGGFPISGVASSLENMSAKPFGEPSGSSSSYGGNPLAAAAGLAAIEAIDRGQAGREFGPRRRR